jgi:hypothetical protein
MPAKKSLEWAEVIDAYRVVPRLLLLGYGYLVWHVTTWFMSLPEPTTQQAALVTAVVGITAPIAGFYQQSGRKWDRD